MTEHTRHGVRKRHTFVLDEDTEDEPGGPHWRWYSEKPPSKPPSGALFDAPGIPSSHQRWWAVRTRPLPDVVPLATGLDVAAPTLVVIFEAIVSQGHHTIGLDQIKRIVSQLGSRIAGLDALTAEQRQLAEPALYTQILARCSNI